jgi:hypothetical protein
VHNICLRYFEKNGKDLFKEGKSNRWIFKAVRNEFFYSLYASDRFEDLFRPVVNEVTGETIQQEFLLDSSPSIVDNLIYNELDKFIKRKIESCIKQKSENSNACKFDKQLNIMLTVYEMIKFGYSNIDIAKQLGISEQSASYYKKQIKDSIKYMSLNNPFHADNTVIKKSITQQTWEEKPQEDRDKYAQHDENEYYKLYKHIETGDGLLVKLRQGKINYYLQNGE